MLQSQPFICRQDAGGCPGASTGQRSAGVIVALLQSDGQDTGTLPGALYRVSLCTPETPPLKCGTGTPLF